MRTLLSINQLQQLPLRNTPHQLKINLKQEIQAEVKNQCSSYQTVQEKLPTLIKVFSSSEQDTQPHPQTVSSKRQLLLLQVLCFPRVFLEDALYTMVMGNMEPFSKGHKEHQHTEIYFSTIYFLSFQNCGRRKLSFSYCCAFSISEAK